MSKGFRVAEAGHVVNALPPVDITGGKTRRPSIWPRRVMSPFFCRSASPPQRLGL
jgi:hypothetical protein